MYILWINYILLPVPNRLLIYMVLPSHDYNNVRKSFHKNKNRFMFPLTITEEHGCQNHVDSNSDSTPHPASSTIYIAVDPWVDLLVLTYFRPHLPLKL